jgi:hypothetical protein
VLDDEWSLGIWQPEFRRDYLSPAQAGLAGAYLEILPEGHFRLTAFGSPGFIPERGVPIEQRDGTLSSHSRWFVSPPSSVSLFEQQTPVDYELEVPKLTKLVAHPGGGLMLGWQNSQGSWSSLAYAYKPINRLLLGYDGYLDVSRSVVMAKLYPRVLYHHLAALQGGFRGRGFGATLAVLGEKPVRDKTPESWTTQEISPSLAMSSSVELSPWGASERKTSFALSYLRQWGGNEADAGPFASPGVSSFESRYPYQSALALDLKLPFRRFLASSRMVHDFVNEGTLVRAELRYRPDNRWTMGIGADLLGAGDTGGVNDANFISRYRSNDRVHGGVSYEF